MSPGRAVSIPCWHRRGRPRANVIMARNAAAHVFNIGDLFGGARGTNKLERRWFS
jgi:hypothetical protein